MHRETLLRLSIEEVNFTSARKTNIAPSVLKAGGNVTSTGVACNTAWSYMAYGIASSLWRGDWDQLQTAVVHFIHLLTLAGGCEVLKSTINMFVCLHWWENTSTKVFKVGPTYQNTGSNQGRI